MIIQFSNEFVQNLGIGDSTTYGYIFIHDENDNYDTKTIQYFVTHGLGLCIRVDSYVEHMCYACSFIHNTSVPIYIKNIKYYRSLNTNTALFAWGAYNPNKNIM